MHITGIPRLDSLLWALLRFDTKQSLWMSVIINLNLSVKTNNFTLRSVKHFCVMYIYDMKIYAGNEWA